VLSDCSNSVDLSSHKTEQKRKIRSERGGGGPGKVIGKSETWAMGGSGKIDERA